MIDYVSIGRRIKYYRKKQNHTQEGLANIMDVTDKYISQLECGTAEISLKRVFEIAKILKTQPQNLIADVNPDSIDYLNSEIVEKTRDLTTDNKELVIRIIDAIITK